MVIFGPIETLQIIDGSREFPVVRTMETVSDRVGFAAPALAYAADAIAGYQGADRIRFDNRLEDIFESSKPDPRPGLEVSPVVYAVVHFGRQEVRIFPRIRQAVGGDAGALMLQTLAIAAINGLRLLLQDNGQNRRIADDLKVAGIHVNIRFASSITISR
jgi:hypothetical protein